MGVPGKKECILVHVEVQGYRDIYFGKKMFTYFSRILNRYNKPVTCIAIFTDTHKRFRPSSYNYSFMGTENNFKYKTIRLLTNRKAN